VDQGNNNEHDEMISSLAESFTSWLGAIYESSLSPTFEIGSLAFFRSPKHMLFFDHLDSTGDFYYHTFKDDPVHTLSASMFLPKQSVLGPRKKDGPPRQPEPTSKPNALAEDAKMDSTDGTALKGNANVVMLQYLVFWEVHACDFERQAAMPTARLGCTTVDYRNFLYHRRIVFY
jgi:alpha 1,2-mannosyltransferase